MNYSRPPLSAEDILNLVSLPSCAGSVLNSFLPAYRAGRITIRAYPLEVLAKLKEVLGPGQPVGACFVNDGDEGTIYLDMSAPLGVLAPFLFHEIVHSLDHTLWDIGKAANSARKPSRKTQEQVILRSETKAFELQHRWVSELSQLDPNYRTFIQSQAARIKILHERLTETDIADLYGLGDQVA